MWRHSDRLYALHRQLSRIAQLNALRGRSESPRHCVAHAPGSSAAGEFEPPDYFWIPGEQEPREVETMVLLFVGAQGATLRPGNLRYRVMIPAAATGCARG
jgi:hypothetical protein